MHPPYRSVFCLLGILGLVIANTAAYAQTSLSFSGDFKGSIGMDFVMKHRTQINAKGESESIPTPNPTECEITGTSENSSLDINDVAMLVEVSGANSYFGKGDFRCKGPNGEVDGEVKDFSASGYQTGYYSNGKYVDGTQQNFKATLSITRGSDRYWGATGTLAIVGSGASGSDGHYGGDATFKVSGTINLLKTAVAKPSGDGRPLTLGEIAMANEVFQSSITYTNVRIYQHAAYSFQPDDTVMTPDGSIYYPPSSHAYSRDFSMAAPSLKCIFIHEMTHVKQFQVMGSASFKSRIIAEYSIHSKYANYHYSLNEKSNFGSDFTLEQQATIIENYYGLWKFGAYAFHKNTWNLLPFWTTPEPANLNVYRKVLYGNN